jgi:hypothetical protein
MHRSSESIASLAAALAKAQVLLTNPEKSLTAAVGTDWYDEPGRTFRYGEHGASPVILVNSGRCRRRACGGGPASSAR